MPHGKSSKQPDPGKAGLGTLWLTAPISTPIGTVGIVNVARGLSDSATESFVKERTRLHELYIKEQERTKRVGLILAAVLILAAAATVLFAPKGREVLSYWMGAALVIFAAGAVGYKRVWGKTANSGFGADQDQRKL
jgi:hypothetical protein